MKQYTTPEQTTKLIELGFEKPNNEVKAEQAGDYAWYNPAYSIGELIEKLPLYRIEFDLEIWVDTPRGGFYATELIDALFEACVKLKEKGML